MKKLFIYYSFTGNGDEVAKKLEEKGYEIRKVEEDYKMPKSFFMQMMSGGFRAGIGVKGKLKEYNNDVSNYDEVVIGSPIWNGRFPPATNGILAETDLSNKVVKFVLYSGSGEGPKASKKINKLFENATVIFLQEPKKHIEEFKKLKDL